VVNLASGTTASIVASAALLPVFVHGRESMRKMPA